MVLPRGQPPRIGTKDRPFEHGLSLRMSDSSSPQPATSTTNIPRAATGSSSASFKLAVVFIVGLVVGLFGGAFITPLAENYLASGKNGDPNPPARQKQSNDERSQPASEADLAIPADPTSPTGTAPATLGAPAGPAGSPAPKPIGG